MNNGQLPAHPASADKFNLNEMGLTKREIFTKAAMQALAGTYNPLEQYSVNGGFLDIDQISQDAVKLADRTLAELEKPQS